MNVEENNAWTTNVDGTRQIVTKAAREGARHLIFLSTGGVYGYSDGTAWAEDAPVRPIRYYGYTKWIGEIVASMHHSLFGLPVTILRLFFPFGSGQRHSIFVRIPQWIRNGAPITIYKNQHPKMNPVHVDDVVTAVERVITPAEGLRVFNVCGNETVSFPKIVELFEQKMGCVAVREDVDSYHGDILGDNSRLRQLGWAPRQGIESLPDTALENCSNPTPTTHA